jgi:hypothetical protein
MMSINQKISILSANLNKLNSDEFSVQVQNAINKNDKNALVRVCKKAKIPGNYISSIVSVIMSVSPQKYPDEF